MSEKNLIAILLWSCPDKKGLVSRISHFIFERGGNIIDLDEHVDSIERLFFLRVAWDMSGFSIGPHQLEEAFLPLAKEFQADWTIRLDLNKRRLAIFVSQYDHCLQEILWRQEIGEFDAEIACIISNHPDLKFLAERYRIPFHVFPVTKENKTVHEEKELEFLEKEKIDTIILARYMQILSPIFVKKISQPHH